MIMAGPHYQVVLSYHSRGGFKKYLISPHSNCFYHASFRFRIRRQAFDAATSHVLLQMRALRAQALANALPRAPKRECFKSFRRFLYKE
jgi:hypothetical protein